LTVLKEGIRHDIKQPAGPVDVSGLRALRNDLAQALHVSALKVVSGEKPCLEFENPNPSPVRLLKLREEARAVDDKPLPDVTTVLGLTGDGTPLYVDLPSGAVEHVLVTGVTGAGKTTLLRTMAAGLALEFGAHAVRIAAINLDLPTTLPHLIRPVIHDQEEGLELLSGIVRLIERNQKVTPMVVFIDDLEMFVLHAPEKMAVMLETILLQGPAIGVHVVASARADDLALLNGVMPCFKLRIEAAEFGRGDFWARMHGERYRFQGAYIGGQELEYALTQ
jgi:DNA segregation ATPase FtsK/SpoIIIE-like protein